MDFSIKLQTRNASRLRTAAIVNWRQVKRLKNETAHALNIVGVYKVADVNWAIS